MASVGGADAERNSLVAADRSSDFPLPDETQLFHYQPSPPSSSVVREKPGDNFKHCGGDEFQFEQFTEPLYDDSFIGDGIETQVVDLIEEETQVFEIDGETQLLDDPGFHVSMGTQVLDFEDEVVLDSESEGTDVTEVVSDTDGYSDDETGQGFRSFGNEKIQETTTLCENDQGSKEQSFSSGCLQRSSGSSRSFASIRTAALRASALASRKINTITDTKGGSTPILTGPQVSDKSTIDSNVRKSEPSVVADQNHDFRACDGNLRGINYAKNGLIRSEAARKLFDDESSAEKEVPCGVDNEDAREREFEVSSRILCSSLSYVESQEPGELSQANALNFVERFLNENLFEAELENDHRKGTETKPRPPSVAKGTQIFAKIAASKYALGEARIFDWVDGHEDEGGGDFFVRKKEELFCGVQSRKSSTELWNPKGRAQDKTSTHEVSDAVLKRMVNSDSKLILRNPKDGVIMKEAGMSYKRNLSKEFDKVNFSTIAERNAPDRLDVGLDTQLAAEALEALINREEVETQKANKVQENVRANLKGPFGVRTRSKTRSEQCISVKRRRGSEDCTPLTMRRTSKRCHKESLVVPHDRSKNDMECGTELQKQEKSANSNANKYNNSISGRIEHNKVTIKSVSKGNNDVALQRNCSNALRSGRLRSSVRCSSRKEETPVEVNPSIPIARRTRLSMLSNLLTAEFRHGTNHKVVVDSIDKKIKDNSVRRKERSSLVLNDIGEVKNAKSRQKDREDLALIVRDFDRGAWNCTRKRRSCYRSLDGIGKFKQSIIPEDSEQPAYSLRSRSRGSIRSSNVNSSLRKIRTSGNSSTLSASIHANSEGKMLLGDAEIERQIAVALPCDSAVPSGNIRSKSASTKALKHTRKIWKLSSFANDSVMASTNCDRMPKKKSRPSLSSSIPVGPLTPTKSSSPICKGDEYLKQSCKGSLELRSLNSVDQELVTPLKDGRSSKDLTQIRILFSQHLDEDVTKHQRKILACLSISEVSSILDATHFIADKFVRTRNMLEAVASGKPIVTHLWLGKIGQVNTLIDEEAYILRDIKKEKEFGFCMPVSLAQARKWSLLQGRKVFITPNTKPGKDVISSLARAVQGQVVERLGRSALSDIKVSDDLLILSCEDDYGICIPFLEKGASVYSSELLLNGIVTQKLDFERYGLFSEHVKRTRSSVWLKKNDKFLPLPSGKRR